MSDFVHIIFTEHEAYAERDGLFAGVGEQQTTGWETAVIGCTLCKTNAITILDQCVVFRKGNTSESLSFEMRSELSAWRQARVVGFAVRISLGPSKPLIQFLMPISNRSRNTYLGPLIIEVRERPLPTMSSTTRDTVQIEIMIESQAQALRSTTYSHSCEEISSTIKSRNIWNTRRFTGNKRITHDLREAGIYYSVALPPIHLSPFVPILTASSCLIIVVFQIRRPLFVGEPVIFVVAKICGIDTALSVDLTLRKLCGPFAIGRLIADASLIFAEFGDARTISGTFFAKLLPTYSILSETD
ncbi:hypothetical protein EV421DRAFT_1740012 [Armillaria borealis]|uniref:Uncharacterized protein n=1 Tax=Armillaria borealis TaxID=47425 RepID=A0AA39J504_9AGAR|nr:hypothetical protein EV421DRAFT_1740012 [Armillaria borealis]